jgi:hypothetical protein
MASLFWYRKRKMCSTIGKESTWRMSNQNSKHLMQASEYWNEGQLLDAGRLIFENLPIEVRPKWASRVLALVVKRTGVKLPPIERILQIASNPSEWNKARDAFSSVRTSTLELEELGERRSNQQALLLRLLLLTELVAKSFTMRAVQKMSSTKTRDGGLLCASEMFLIC